MMTPILLFYGTAPEIAVAASLLQTAGISISGTLSWWQRKGVDFRMGSVLVIGGLLGSLLGSYLFKFMREAGLLDLVIPLIYVMLLSFVGILMLAESLMTLRLQQQEPNRKPSKRKGQDWAHRIPGRMSFPRSILYISPIAPLIIGFVLGMIAAIMGVGGGFLMVPAMIYILGMSAAVVIGTSLFQIVFVTSFITITNSISTQTVDIIMVLFLLIGGIVGTQFGVSLARNTKNEHLRLLMGIVIILVALRLLLGLIWIPDEIYTIVSKETIQ